MSIENSNLDERHSVQGGVVAARRKISPLSYPVFDQLKNGLEQELNMSVHLSSSRDLGVSVLSFYRLNHIVDVPPTNTITELISSAATPIEVRLGRLAFYGKKLSGIEALDFTTRIGVKLAVDLISDELHQEAQQYEDEYVSRGIKLQAYPGDGEYHAHCSLAHITAPAGYFKNPDSLANLSQSTILKETISSSSVVLMPIRHVS